MTITCLCCKWDMWERMISMMEWFCSHWPQIIYIFSSCRANAWLVLHCSTGLTTSGRIRQPLQPTEGCLGRAASPWWHILMFYSQKACRVSQHGGGDTRLQRQEEEKSRAPKEGQSKSMEKRGTCYNVHFYFQTIRKGLWVWHKGLKRGKTAASPPVLDMWLPLFILCSNPSRSAGLSCMFPHVTPPVSFSSVYPLGWVGWTYINSIK